MKIILIVVAINSTAFCVSALFNSEEKELAKGHTYHTLGLHFKIIVGFSLVVGVIDLPVVQITEKNYVSQYDFYSEEEEEFEELETG